MNRTRSLLLALVVPTLMLAGCGGSNSATSADGREALVSKDAPAEGVVPAAGGAQVGAPAAEPASAGDAVAVTDPSNRAAVQTRAIIANGTVSLRADDLDSARLAVRKVLDTYRGEISEEETTSNDKGELESSRLVLRVPSADFGKAIDDLEKISKFHTITTGQDDVTTQVIDIDARVSAQTKSLARIEALLAQATTFRDIVAIEAQLTSRQAELESMKAQQAWLADQTSMSTITVYLEHLSVESPQHDKSGFLGGLSAGWHALGSATRGAAQAVGALLPFALAIALVGFPLWWAGRRLLAGRADAWKSAHPAEPAVKLED